MSTEYDERFQIFLLLGILFALLEFILSERASNYSGFRWRSRISGLGSQTKIASFVLFFFLVQNAHAIEILTPEVINKNNQAVELLEKEQYFEAYKITADNLGSAPFQPEIRLNLGYTFEKNKENEKALKEYVAVGRDEKVETLKRFQAYFNAGRVSGELKNVSQAIDYYQQALNIDQQSVEAKTNIELLLSQQGGGGGESDQKDDKGKDFKDKEKEEQGKGQQEAPRQPNKPGKQKPQPFKSEELSEGDVKNILEELRRQEQKNRAKMEEKNAKETTEGPQW